MNEREGGRGRSKERADAIFGEKERERRHATPTDEPARANAMSGSCELDGGKERVEYQWLLSSELPLFVVVRSVECNIRFQGRGYECVLVTHSPHVH